MTSSDRKSAAPPLRKRKSKRFDRSGANQHAGGSADVEGAAPVVTPTASPEANIEAEVTTPNVDPTTIDTTGGDSSPSPSRFVPTANQANQPSIVADGAVRTKTLDERQACGRCGHELSMVNIEVDGNVLVMESCDNCDARRWHLSGEQIELEQVLDHVGEHAGRRR